MAGAQNSHSASDFLYVQAKTAAPAVFTKGGSPGRYLTENCSDPGAISKRERHYRLTISFLLP